MVWFFISPFCSLWATHRFAFHMLSTVSFLCFLSLFLSFLLVDSSMCSNPPECGKEVPAVLSRTGQTQLYHSQKLPGVPQHLQFPHWKEATGTEDSQEQDAKWPRQGLSLIARKVLGPPSEQCIYSCRDAVRCPTHILCNRKKLRPGPGFLKV